MDTRGHIISCTKQLSYYHRSMWTYLDRRGYAFEPLRLRQTFPNIAIETLAHPDAVVIPGARSEPRDPAAPQRSEGDFAAAR